MNDPLPEHAVENRNYWDSMADQWVAPGERHWKQDDPTWGIWSVPESELNMLPVDMTGMRAIELGCGTGYVSSWMVRRGASAVGIDNSEKQLETAARLAQEHGKAIELIHGNAETTGLPDQSFDFAISEYGAAIWCDPYSWIPEAHRLLGPGGSLVFLGTHPLAQICAPLNGDVCGRELVRDYFKLRRLDWRDVEIDPGGVEFNLPISKWIALFHETGFVVEDYHEIQAPAAETETRFYATAEWAKQYPTEQVWKLRKVSS